MNTFEKNNHVDMNLVPMVIEQTNRGERSYDIFSRLLKAVSYTHLDVYKRQDELSMAVESAFISS